jgi:hypothetical protein
MALDPTVINKAKLDLRAKSNTDLLTFVRDMREYITALDARLAQIENLLENHETRITTLE